MSENADITAALLKSYGSFSLTSVLSDPKVLPYFRSLTLTDQPRTRPLTTLFTAERSRHLILSLALPPAHTADVTLPLVAAAFQLIDIMAGEGRIQGARGGLVAQLRPDTRTKLKKIREDVDKEIKEDAAKEKREAEAEEKAAAKRKVEQERLSRLSATEQKKVNFAELSIQNPTLIVIASRLWNERKRKPFAKRRVRSKYDSIKQASDLSIYSIWSAGYILWCLVGYAIN